MAEFRAVCRVDEVVEGKALGVKVEGLGIAIFRDQDKFYALHNRCPHQNTLMDDGWVEEGEAVCPHHNWRFKLNTGRCTTTRGNSIHTFPCEVRDGIVWVCA